jgi:membrane-bound lytic murein transglycosylase MltF
LTRSSATTRWTGLACALALVIPAARTAAADAKRTATLPAGSRKLGASLLDAAGEPAFGDLPEIRARGTLRVLVPYGLTTFYLHGGEVRGVEYDAMIELERRLNGGKQSARKSRLRVVFIPTPFDRLLADLQAGKGDVAASLLTVTEERKALVDFSRPYVKDVASVVVSRAGSPPVNSTRDLAGRVVHVPGGSSTLSALRELSAAMAAQGMEPVEVVEVPGVTWEDVLQMVGSGMFDHTVTDDKLATLWARALPSLRVDAGACIREGSDLAWAVRKESPGLRAALDDLAIHRADRTHSGVAESIRRYLGDPKRLRNALEPGATQKKKNLRPFFVEAGDRYGLDWLFLAAQAYQESRLDPDARNPSGAIGLFQVKPETGAWLGFPDVTGARENALAGAAYMALLRSQYFDDERIAMADRLHFALAAYNAGPGRVAGLRKKARTAGLDPDRWFDHVEMVALREIGQETPRYVANVVRYYLAYRLASELDERKARSKGDVAGP